MNVDVLSVLPPAPENGSGMSEYLNPHVAELQHMVPVEHLVSMVGAPDALKLAVTDERRKRAHEGAVQISTIVGQKEALERAKIDPVTGLRNRKAFQSEVPIIFNRSKPGELTALYFDLNGLKRANDNYGHDAGDAYLQAEAESISSGLRPTDLVYRIGGDEIVAILDGKITLKDLKIIVERIKNRGTQATEGLNLPEDLHLGLSVGGAVRRESDSPASLLKRADQACEKNKKEIYNKLEAETGINYRR